MNALFLHVHSRVAVKTHRSGTLGAEWQCEPTVLVRSGPSGSANSPLWYARGRVAVPVTLPLGGERTSPHVHSRVAVQIRRFGTLGVEWQCRPHCHMASSVGSRYARGRVAVRTRRSGTLEAEWQCRSHCHSVVNVPLLTFTVEWQCDMRHKRNGCRADGFGAGRGLQSSWVRDARAGARREGQ